MDAFEFALGMELDGKAYYENLAGETSQPGLKKVFLGLAADEQKHYDTILAIRGLGSVGMADSAVLEDARGIFRELVEEKRNSPAPSTELLAYRHAMTIEARSVKFYEEAARLETEPAVSGLFQRIAEEEKKHFTVMDNIYSYMLAPHTFLAWGEFSNLTEYY